VSRRACTEFLQMGPAVRGETGARPVPAEVPRLYWFSQLSLPGAHGGGGRGLFPVRDEEMMSDVRENLYCHQLSLVPVGQGRERGRGPVEGARTRKSRRAPRGESDRARAACETRPWLPGRISNLVFFSLFRLGFILFVNFICTTARAR